MATVDDIIAWLAQQQIPAYLVGGHVRDRLLGRPLYDLDVAVAGDSLWLARRLADHFGGAYYPLDEARGTGRAILYDAEHRLVVDVACFRGQGPAADLAADLADRDFTVNALAADVRDPLQVIDHHEGLADLNAGLIRPVTEESIRNDPIRALRAVRLAAALGFDLTPESEALLRRDGVGLVHVSGERIRDELARLLALPCAASYLEQLDTLGLLTVILPELEPLRGVAQPMPHHLDVLSHSLETVRALEFLLEQKGQSVPLQTENGAQHATSAMLPEELCPFSDRLHAHLEQVMGDVRPRLVTLKLAALLHDSGKAAARTVETRRPERERIRFIGHDQVGVKTAGTVFRRLRFTSAETRLAETIVGHHMRPLLLAEQGQVSSRAVYRFFRDTGESGVDVLLHALADHRATYAVGAAGGSWPRLVALAARLLFDYWERSPERVNPPLLVNGDDLQRELNLQPGPQIGALLEAVREAQVDGEVRTRDEALTMVRQQLGQ